MKTILIFCLTLTCFVHAFDNSILNRYAGYHDTVINMSQTGLQPGLQTYPVDKTKFLRIPLLGKAQMCLERDGKTLFLHKSSDADFTIQHWGLTVNGSIDNSKVNMDFFPTIFGTETSQRDGIAILKLEVDHVKRGDTICINYGSINRGDWVVSRNRDMLLLSDEFPGADDDILEFQNNSAILYQKDVPVFVAIKGISQNAQVETIKHPQHNIAQIRFSPKTAGDIDCWLIVNFSNDKNTLLKRKINPAQEFSKTKQHYNSLIQNIRIDTPIKNINDSFKWALLGMEYCYHGPTGWIESLDHWTTFYSMMYPRAAESLGQFERSKKCLLRYAQAVGADGRMRNIDPSGLEAISFYWHQHYIWDFEHYLDWTGDIETIKELYPTMKKVVAQTFDAYDRDKNLLIGFDHQIGYQEDFVLTPNDGGSASMAGVEMLRIISRIADVIGYQDEAAQYKAKEELARQRLEKELWSKDLGRFIYYRDPYGKKHWEAQYHSFVWPGMFGFMDAKGVYTSLRHLQDNLISPAGLLYVSNNFPTHPVGTTGGQEAASQSAIAAAGLCMGNMHNEGADLFEAFGNLVMNETNQGCFPELAGHRGTWFSATASFYIEGVVEGLFGIKWKNADTLIIKPAVPEKWGKASIQLAKTKADYKLSKGERRYTISADKSVTGEFEVFLPFANSYKLTVNGKTVEPIITPAVKGVMLKTSLAKAKTHDIEIQFTPLTININSPEEIAGGEEFDIWSIAANITSVHDPLGLINTNSIRTNLLQAKLNSGLMDEYKGFGEMGEKTFARRTFFLELESNGYKTLWPIDFKIASEKAIAQEDSDFTGTYFNIGFEKNQESKNWTNFKWFDVAYHCLGRKGDPLADLVARGEQNENGASDVQVKVEELDGMPFTVTPGKLLVASDILGCPSQTIKVGKRAKKLHFLMLPFLNNKDVYSEVAQIKVRCKSDFQHRATGQIEVPIYFKRLYYPGDLDNWYAEGRDHGYGSYSHGWNSSKAFFTKDATFTVYTIDLEKEKFVDSITIDVVGRHPVMGIVGITAEKSSKVVFEFSDSSTIDDWKIEGNAFEISDSGFFKTPAINSLVKAGETATGKATSPEFILDENFNYLSLVYNGGNSVNNSLRFDLIDSQTQKVLYSFSPSGTHMMQTHAISIEKWKNTKVRLVLVDDNSSPSFAWLGLESATLSAQ